MRNAQMMTSIMFAAPIVTRNKHFSYTNETFSIFFIEGSQN